MIDVDALLAPVSESAPCGEDLEYDAHFMALEQAARGKAEQQFGDTVVAAEEPDWTGVVDAATALLARTKDLRVATYLARGLARTGGPVGLGQGLQVLVGLCERYWDQLYPQLDPDDGNDPIMRMNALAPLAHPEAGLRELRDANCVRTRAGAITVKQIEYALALKEAPAGQSVPSEPEILSALREAAAADAGFLDAVRAAGQQANALQNWLNERVGSEQAVDLRPLRVILNAVGKLVDQVAAEAAPAATAPADGDASEAAAASGQAVVKPVAAGELRSRDDVIRLIDRAIEFLERNEPTNPAPLLLRRAQRLMTMNFLEIIEDMTPDGASTVKHLAGIRE
ncbi:type VI secretion system protein TssA [Caldimonas brevitalea]|uniref:Type VI secretion system protein ImpA n=1 Tax=Caldimonas brevitalea TaxID=413882 RepID=A0A0G3BHF9_9BURK|nr:type VI secretion system protein TssA [Caldimonas brevitalea]AKJ28869.1 type VI secretion system protein ImpA [Caldimonas brevitalea]